MPVEGFAFMRSFSRTLHMNRTDNILSNQNFTSTLIMKQHLQLTCHSIGDPVLSLNYGGPRFGKEERKELRTVGRI